MLNLLKKAFLRFLNSGVDPRNDPEVNRRIISSNLLSFLGFSVFIVFGTNAFVVQHYTLAWAIVLAAILLLVAYQSHRFTWFNKSHAIGSKIQLIGLQLLIIYLVYTGGHANTGPLWVYIAAPAAFFLEGLRKGIYFLLIYLAVIIVMLFYPDNQLLGTTYTFEFKGRLVLSFITVAILFAFYEYTRQRSYEEIQELSQNFERQAHQDQMTKLSNRHFMREQLQYEYDRSRRSQKKMSILLCDVDNFKKVNDKYGHDTGDAVLISLAQLFTGSLRKQDIVSRWGGEEFLFLLPETDASEAFVLAEKIRSKVENTEFKHEENTLHLTVCFGISEVKINQSIDSAISRADHFLYQAKENGRNLSLPNPNG